MKFKEEDIKKINSTLQKVEKECGAEVVPILIKQSDDYPGARWRLIITCSFILSFLLFLMNKFLMNKNLSAIELLLFQFVFLYIGYFLSLIPALHKLFFISEKVKEEVHQRALSAFLDYNIHQTKNRIGILIMISLLERRAEILCDVGINQKISKNSWNPILDSLLQNIQKGNLIQGIEKTLISCGELVKKHDLGEKKKEDELKHEFLILEN